MHKGDTASFHGSTDMIDSRKMNDYKMVYNLVTWIVILYKYN